LSAPAARTEPGRRSRLAASGYWLAGAALTVAAGAAMLASCLRSTSFRCTGDAQCTGAAGGRCELQIGYCSFSDGSCASGSRFGDQSGPYAGKCVGEEGGPDGAIDAAVDGTDGTIDTPPVGCPGTYAPLAGVATHVYRVITAAGTWTSQRATCMAENGYLAEPDDVAELAAINMAAGPNEIWVGVTDQAVEGTFVTGRGGAVTFLPWTTGEPDNMPAGGADCVFSSATGMYADDRCSTLRRAVCECEP
jgi:hypothetical protein